MQNGCYSNHLAAFSNRASLHNVNVMRIFFMGNGVLLATACQNNSNRRILLAEKMLVCRYDLYISVASEISPIAN